MSKPDNTTYIASVMDIISSPSFKVYRLPVLSRGASGIVYKFSDNVVIKAPLGTEESKDDLATEGAIYERLGSHPNITSVLSSHENMLVLERLQYPLRKRLMDLRNAAQLPTSWDILRWAAQITEALEYTHSRQVLQVDIGPHNILLDWDENVKLNDFAGSSIDGSIPSVLPSVHSEHPRIPATEPSLQSEIFALGSTLYELETTHQPYSDKQDSEIEKLFSAQDFPDTSGFVLGEVIAKCWFVQYENVGEAGEDIANIRKRLDDEIVRTVPKKDKIAWWGKSYIFPSLIVVLVTFLAQWRRR